MDNNYIKSMVGYITRQRGLGQDGFELTVKVSFDAKEFNKIKKKSCPLAAGMAQIKNVVFDATGIRGIPSYAPQSYNQRFPRASKGTVTLDIHFEVNQFSLNRLKVDVSSWNVFHSVELNKTLEATRQDGHLFAKTAIASNIGH